MIWLNLAGTNYNNCTSVVERERKEKKKKEHFVQIRVS